MSSSPQHQIVGSSPSLHQVEAVKKQRRFSGKSQQSLGVIEVFLGLPNLVVTLWLWLTVCHGIDGPNRNRWFTELNSMVIFHGYLSHNQPIEIDVFPIKNGGFSIAMLHNQMVFLAFCMFTRGSPMLWGTHRAAIGSVHGIHPSDIHCSYNRLRVLINWLTKPHFNS